MIRSLLTLHALFSPALAGSVLWDGRFNDLTTSGDLTKWTFSNEVGPYQWYIHGDSNVNKYINFDPSYKNPADSSSKQGAKFTIDSTSYWHGQNMRRTELIPQTSAAINKGHVFYHFSVKRMNVNAPSTADEHQVCFFESHFTELKYGLISGEQGTADANLRWDINGQSQWNTTLDAGVWHNVAYEIDFGANTVGFWHSTGSDSLKQVVAPKTASTSSNGADWHLGILRLPNSASQNQGGSSQGGSGSSSGGSDNGPEDWYFSGVYIESGPLTTSVAGPAGKSSGSASGANAGAASGASSGGGTDSASGTGSSGGSAGSSSSASNSTSATTDSSATSTSALAFATPSSSVAASTSGSGATSSTSSASASANTSTAGSGSDASSGGSGSAGGASGSGTQSSGQTGNSDNGATNGGGSGQLKSQQDAVRILQSILAWVQNS